MTEEPPLCPDSPDALAARDVALMLRVRAGDTEAFAELVEIHQHRVVGTIAKMLGDEHEAEDLAQQVFLRVWRSAARYEPTAKFTTWLFTILRNLVFNESRRRSRHPVSSLDAPRESDDERPREHLDAKTKAPDTRLLDDEMLTAIDRAIEALPETQRLAVIMRRYEDSSYEDIAEVLGLTVPAVKSLLFRARTELRQRLQGYLEP